jgi:hypothetical protein
MSQQQLKQLLAPGVIGAILIFVIVGIIGSALHNPTPKDVPVAILAPAPFVEQIKQAANAKAPGVLDAQAYSNSAAATKDLKDGTVYGVVAMRPTGVEIQVSSASGESTKQLVSQAFSGVAATQHVPVKIMDITPQASGMGHSLVMMFLYLITLIAALVGQIILLRNKEAPAFGAWLGSTVLAAVLVGLSGAGVAALLGEFDGAFIGVAAVLASASFAFASVMAGAHALLDEKGMGLVALLLVPLGLATSGAVINVHFLPDFYAAIAPYMPSAATIDALRKTAYLDNTAIGAPYLVLTAWAAVGLATTAATTKLRLSKNPPAALGETMLFGRKKAMMRR